MSGKLKTTLLVVGSAAAGAALYRGVARCRLDTRLIAFDKFLKEQRSREMQGLEATYPSFVSATDLNRLQLENVELKEDLNRAEQVLMMQRDRLLGEEKSRQEAREQLEKVTSERDALLNLNRCYSDPQPQSPGTSPQEFDVFLK